MLVGLSDVLFTSTHCRLRLTYLSREHALWTPQQWSCAMFSDESRFSLQCDFRRTLYGERQVPCYHQENTIERHRTVVQDGSFGGGIILVPEATCMFKSVTMTGHIYGDGILNNMYTFVSGAP
ncbi:HTH_Tnp_Tc3_2 domain-containing protein [Trichonephila clavipes]|nr:HTH_Tnp_Tc3_2 domain-containing protein [Trichonephila clavipes]